MNDSKESNDGVPKTGPYENKAKSGNPGGSGYQTNA